MHKAARHLCVVLMAVMGLPSCAFAQATIGGIVSRGGPGGGRVAPTVACATQTGTVGTAYSSAVLGSGGSLPYVNYMATDGVIPTGLTLNPTTGALTGSPTTVNTYSFRVYITDSQGHQGFANCTMVISSAGALSLTCPTIIGSTGSFFSSAFTVAGGVPPMASYAIFSGSLPTGVTLNTTSGTLTGTPTTAGGYTFVGRVTDAAATTANTPTCTVTISVPGNPPASATCPTSTDNSPTGRNPASIWTCARSRVYQQMYTDYLLNTANPPTAGGKFLKQVFYEYGRGGGLSGEGPAALLYQITGDPAYAQAGYNLFATNVIARSQIVPIPDFANWCREGCTRYMILYDWFYSGWTQPQRDAVLNALLTLLETNLNWVGRRTNDSDQTTGVYFGSTLMYYLTRTFSTRAANDYTTDLARNGGLTPTGVNFDTDRNALKYYVTKMAVGGNWIESSEYDPGTSILVMEGAEAIRTVTGIDYYPEITAWEQDWALRNRYYMTPDFLSAFAWGDVEAHAAQPPDPVQYQWNWNAATIAGLTQGTTNGPHAQDYMMAMYDTFGNVGAGNEGPGSAEIIANGMMYFNPYATRGSGTSGLSMCKPIGGLFCHDGWTTNKSLFGTHCLQDEMFVDHQPLWYCDIQFYRKGLWVLKHPISYLSEPSYYGDGVNAMFFKDFMSSSYEYINTQTSSSAAYGYVTGTTGGFYTPYDLAPVPLQEYTRSVLYLPSTDSASDTVVIYDRANMKNPLTLGGLSAYPGSDQTRMNAAPVTIADVFHTPVSPTIVGQEATWSVGPQTVVLQTLVPVAATMADVDETTLTQGSWPSLDVAQKHRMLRISQTSESQFETFLHVFQAHDGIVRSNTLINNTGEFLQGVIVKRASHDNVVALFNAKAGPDLGAAHDPDNQTVLDCVRYRQVGYTASFTTTTTNATVYLFDLDPTGTWTKNVDGGGASSLTVNSTGLASLALSSSGAHTVVVGGAGANCGLNTVTGSETGLNTIALDASSASALGSGTVLSWSHTTNGSSRTLAIGVFGGSTDTLIGCTYASVPMTLIQKKKAPADRWIYAFQLIAPATGANTAQCVFSPGVDASLGLGVSYTGTDQVTQPHSSDTGENTSGLNLMIGVPVVRSNSWMVMLAKNGVGAANAGTQTRGVISSGYGLGLFDSNGPVAVTNRRTLRAQVGTGTGWGGIAFTLNPLVP